jgi:uncharacterized membrane protein
VSNLCFIGFDNEADALAMRDTLLRLQDQFLIEMEDIAVVKRDLAGETQRDTGGAGHPQPTFRMIGIGATAGAFWGLLLGAIFLTPLLGAATGAAAGAIKGKASELALDRYFLDSLGTSLQPGGAGVFILVRRSDPARVLEGLKAFAGKGKVLQTSLSAEKEAELRAFIEAPESTPEAAQ